MSKKGLTRQQVSAGLTYVAQKPAFLQNFGQTASPGPSDRGGRGGRGGRDEGGDGREPLPERPREGRWASGSDDEGDRDRGHRGRGGAGAGGDASGSDDEWGDVYGGGGEDGPQVVVLKEGRHLTAEEVRRERRRAAGKPSQSPPPQHSTAPSNPSAPLSAPSSLAKPRLHAKPNTSKRKLVGTASGADEDAEPDKADKGAKTKDGVGRSKKKKVKGMLSFNEAEGEDPEP